MSVLVAKKAPSTKKSTSKMFTLSVTFAVTVTAPETVEPSVGEVTAAVGGVVSGTLVLVIFTIGEKLALPAASKAVVIRVWAPFAKRAVSSGKEYGEVVSALVPLKEPST